MAAALPYQEPGIKDILILSSFLLALNIVNSVLDKSLYCGLVGQVLIGIAWGTPGGKWLSESLEGAVVQLGYLGLVMIVFEGGLSTSIRTMKANMLLAAGVALTGIAAPMALSFFLRPLAGASYVQCFAAGAALCSTSLGTTFTVLSTTGLAATRLGSILSAAAMMDDVVGLVMVQIVSSLGNSGSVEISPVIVLRPVLVSLAFAALIPLACRFVLEPSAAKWDALKRTKADDKVVKALQTKQGVFLTQTMLLLALVVGASYAGASVLLAAYLAGVIGAWWDERNVQNKSLAARTSSLPEEASHAGSVALGSDEDGATRSETVQTPVAEAFQPGITQGETPSADMYEESYALATERILKPFFFASIGFSIPISMMFSGPVIWRGITYTILMLIGKAFCGLWLVRFSVSSKDILVMVQRIMHGVRTVKGRLGLRRLIHGPEKTKVSGPSNGVPEPTLREGQGPTTSVPATKSLEKRPSKPLSLYPAGIMSFAMIARGEIGFLISSVAESNGIFKNATSSESSDEASEIFLIITWAIVLCTIIGPFCVGLLVRRVKRLEAESENYASQASSNKRDVLGAWGVS